MDASMAELVPACSLSMPMVLAQMLDVCSAVLCVCWGCAQTGTEIAAAATGAQRSEQRGVGWAACGVSHSTRDQPWAVGCADACVALPPGSDAIVLRLQLAGRHAGRPACARVFSAGLLLLLLGRSLSCGRC